MRAHQYRGAARRAAQAILEDVVRLGEAQQQISLGTPVEELNAEISSVQESINDLNAEIAQGATDQIIPALNSD